MQLLFMNEVAGRYVVDTQSGPDGPREGVYFWGGISENARNSVSTKDTLSLCTLNPIMAS